MTAAVASDLPRRAATRRRRRAGWPRIDVGKLGAHLALLFLVVALDLPDRRPADLVGARQGPARGVGLVDGARDARTQQGVTRVGRGDRRRSRKAASSSSAAMCSATDTNKHDRRASARPTPTSARSPAGSALPMRDGGEITVQANGDYDWTSPTAFTHTSGPRIYLRRRQSRRASRSTTIVEVLTANGVGRSRSSTRSRSTIPATIIPILMAAFAAYALAWMTLPVPRVDRRRGRRPARRAAADVADPAARAVQRHRPYLRHRDGKGYLGVWLAHTAFGLPLAIYLLRNYMAGLPQGDHGVGAHRRRLALQDLHRHGAAAELPGARLVLDLPVPLDLERPARRDGLPRRAGRQGGADRASS